MFLLPSIAPHSVTSFCRTARSTVRQLTRGYKNTTAGEPSGAAETWGRKFGNLLGQRTTKPDQEIYLKRAINEGPPPPPQPTVRRTLWQRLLGEDSDESDPGKEPEAARTGNFRWQAPSESVGFPSGSDPRISKVEEELQGVNYRFKDPGRREAEVRRRAELWPEEREDTENTNLAGTVGIPVFCRNRTTGDGVFRMLLPNGTLASGRTTTAQQLLTDYNPDTVLSSMGVSVAATSPPTTPPITTPETASPTTTPETASSATTPETTPPTTTPTETAPPPTIPAPATDSPTTRPIKFTKSNRKGTLANALEDFGSAWESVGHLTGDHEELGRKLAEVMMKMGTGARGLAEKDGAAFKRSRNELQTELESWWRSVSAACKDADVTNGPYLHYARDKVQDGATIMSKIAPWERPVPGRFEGEEDGEDQTVRQLVRDYKGFRRTDTATATATEGGSEGHSTRGLGELEREEDDIGTQLETRIHRLRVSRSRAKGCEIPGLSGDESDATSSESDGEPTFGGRRARRRHYSRETDSVGSERPLSDGSEATAPPSSAPRRPSRPKGVRFDLSDDSSSGGATKDPPRDGSTEGPPPDKLTRKRRSVGSTEVSSHGPGGDVSSDGSTPRPNGSMGGASLRRSAGSISSEGSRRAPPPNRSGEDVSADGSREGERDGERHLPTVRPEW